MQIEVLKSKIHRATVTDANINYVGSVTIDAALMNAANLIEFEKVQVLNINNGERIETYVIEGKKGSGVICLNGAAARKFLKGDIVIIVSFAIMDFEEDVLGPRPVPPRAEYEALPPGALPFLRGKEPRPPRCRARGRSEAGDVLFVPAASGQRNVAGGAVGP